jgi:hypothetical protein
MFEVLADYIALALLLTHLHPVTMGAIWAAIALTLVATVLIVRRV